MSEMTTNGTSDDTLIRDSQLTGFSLFKERIGSCCCRIFRKSSNYNLSSVSKDIQEQEDKPSYVNQAFQKEKKERKDKLDKIAKSLPPSIQNPNSLHTITRTPIRSINNKTQETPRSGITKIQTITRPTTSNTFQSKTPLNKSSINKQQVSDEITTDDSSEEESSSEESDSSDSSKKPPPKSANKKR